MVSPRRVPILPGDLFQLRDGSSSRVSDGPAKQDDTTTVLSSLGETIASRTRRLDSILEAITIAAQSLTGATGAAIAMWKDGAVVCRARCGEGAPPLGAHLSADSGISGHCLRTGLVQHCGETQNDARVDGELCLRLGLRSIAVLPIRGWRGINGILLVFSTLPHAFTEQHLALLQRLAALAERARASQPETAATAADTTVEVEQSSGLLPASDRVRDLAMVFLDSKRRPFVLGVAALLGLLLVGFVIWLGWRSPQGIKVKAEAVPPPPSQAVPAHPMDNDRVWKLNPGGESLFFGKHSAGTPVRFASKVDVIPARKTQPAQPVPASSGDDSSPEIVIRHVSPAAPQPADTAAAEPPPISTAAPSPAPLSDMLVASNSMPRLVAVTVSQGISQGYLIHRVAPVYPAQALMTRLQGKVVLDALIAEDGTVQDLKVVQGDPVLARAALEAVQHWRYKPFELNRKPVKMSTTITVKFSLP
ncbi:MAG: TonB family protein [Terriglobales bacterium]